MTGLATLPEASAYGARGGGGGPRPTDPASLAARALNAAMGDDRETALKLYDYGMENYGTDFITAYNSLRDSRELGEASVTPSKPGVLKQVIDTIKVGENAGLPAEPGSTGYEMKPLSGLPRTEGGKGGIIGAGGLPRSPPGPPATFVAEPDQPVVAPPPGGAQLPVASETPLITVGDASGLPPTPAGTGYEMKPLSGLPRTEGGKGGIFGAGGLPTTGGLPRSPPVLRSVNDTAPIEPPEPAPHLPQGADAAVAGSLREAELAATKYRADQQAAANTARAGVLKDATLDAKALIESGMTPEQAVTEALKQPGVAGTVSADELRSSIGLPPVEAPPATASAVPPVPAPGSTGVITPPGAPVPPVPAEPAPSSTGVITSPGAPTPAGGGLATVPRETPQPPSGQASLGPGSGRYGLQPDGTYIDIPPGNEVSLPENTVTMVAGTGLPARMEDDPRIQPGDPRYKGGAARKGGSGIPKPDRQMAAPPDSGGLATTVQAPPPAVDTGTNTTSSTSTTSTTVAAGPPAVDTNQPPVADDSGFMGKPDIWSFLTSAGLGAMASGSPNFLGAVGAGGRAGVEQLGVLRKDQRERQKNLADAQFQKDRIKLGYYDTQHADQRNVDTLRSGERNTDVTTNAANKRNVDTLRSGERNTDVTNTGQTERTILTTQSQERTNKESNDDALARVERQGVLTRELEDERARLALEGKDLDRRGIYDFTIEKGGTVDEAREAALGHTPVKADKPTPMSEKDVTLTHDMVANKLFGAGVSGSTLIETLPPDISIEYQRAVGSKQDAASAYAAGMEVLKKHGITGGKKDGSWWPGDQPELTIPKTAPAPAAAPSSAGGGGTHVYIPGKGVVAK